MESALELLDGVEEDLMARSFLFTDPVSYRDGVEAAADAVRTMLVKIDLVAQEKPREERS